MNNKLKASRHFGKLLHIKKATTLATIKHLLAEQLLVAVDYGDKYAGSSVDITAVGRKRIEQGR